MEIRWGRCVALPFVTLGLAPPASAQTATAGVTAEVVSPSKLAEAAAGWLMSNSPGVFTLRIPGAAQTTTITVTAQTPDGSGGTIDFFASQENVDALHQLIAQITSSAADASGGIYQLSGTMTDGTINMQGVQLILMTMDRDGVIVAIMAFD